MEIAEGDMKMSVTADEEGKFCAMLRPGQYSFTVSMDTLPVHVCSICLCTVR